MLTIGELYLLRLSFGTQIRGKADAAIVPSGIKNFTITQDINKFLPSFDFEIKDDQGMLTHVIPFDQRVSKLKIKFSGAEDIENLEKHNLMDFDTYNRHPGSDYMLQFNGLLAIPN